jgi:hypothetical protein
MIAMSTGIFFIPWTGHFALLLGLFTVMATVGVVVFNVFMRRAGAGLGLAGGIDSQQAGSLT